MEKKRSGFTLIEISIVLLIIGLIVGSILIGRDLILISEIRGQIKQIEQTNIAVSTFRGKYNCIPGDCIDAVDSGLGSLGGDGDNGNGNGIVDDESGFHLTGDEAINFWYHLGQASLIAGQYPVGIIPGVNSPALSKKGMGLTGSKFGGLWYVNRYQVNFPTVASLQNAWLLATQITANSAGGVYLAETAFLLDKKIDDGMPATGAMVVSNGWANMLCLPQYCMSVPVATSTSPDACIDDESMPLQYNLSGDNNISIFSLCLPVIRASF